MVNLTKRYIDSIKVEGADKFFHDDGLKGFYIRVFPSGRKGFGLRYGFHGRKGIKSDIIWYCYLK